MTQTTAWVLAGAIVVACCAVSSAAPAAEEDVEAFGELLAAVQSNPAGASEQEVLELMRRGRALGRAAAVHLAMKGYLAHKFEPESEVTRLAAESAFRAGDYRAAVAGLKTYLKTARPSRETADLAALAYLIEIDLLGAEDDAYLFMTQHGARLRRSEAARKFDPWYLEQAAKRQDVENVAGRLADVLADELPLEEERLYYWQHLTSLMSAIRTAKADHYAALPHLKRIVPRVRGSEDRRARYAFYVANLGLAAGSAGKDDAALAKDFQAVAEAARRYLAAAPASDTVKDIVLVLGGGGDFSRDAWRRLDVPKKGLFVEAFAKVSDADREALLAWDVTARHDSDLATPEQWARLGTAHPDLFAKAYGTRHITFLHDTTDDAGGKALLEAQAAFLKGVPSRSAAAVNSLAAGGSQLDRCVDHLVRRESWHLDAEEVYHVFRSQIWPVWRKLHAEDGKPPSETVYQKALVRFGRKHLAETPVALFDVQAAKDYVNTAWRLASDDGKPADAAGIVEHLESLAWVPYSRSDRNDIFSGPYRSFRSWAERLRNEARKKDSKVDRGDLEAIVPIEEAFKAVLKGDGDPEKAPNDLCRRLAELALATRGGRPADSAGKLVAAIYPEVSDYARRQTPAGRAVWRWVLDSRQGAPWDIQLQAFEHLLDRYALDEPNPEVEDLIYLMLGRRYWELNRMRREHVDLARRLNRTIEQALMKHLDKGRLPARLFDLFRATRAGNGWSHKDWGEKLIARIIEERALENSDWRPYDIRSPAVASMWLIRNEAPGLARKYPPESYFDDWFVEDARWTRLLDRRYWDYGRDKEKKVVTAAAEVLAAYETLPFGYNGEAVTYDRRDFWDWSARALGAPPEQRERMVETVEAAYGRTRWDTYAMGRAYFSTRADTTTPEGRREFFARLRTYVDRQLAAPARVSPPYMGALRGLGDPGGLSREETDTLLAIFPYGVPESWNQGWHFEDLAVVLVRALVAQVRTGDVYEVAPFAWKIARDSRETDLQEDLVTAAEELLDRGLTDLAYVVSDSGLRLLAASLSPTVKDSLTAVKSAGLGLIGPVIPVKQGDRQYPVYAAQVAYLTGRYTTAWETYVANRRLVLQMYKDLDPGFVLWIIDKHTELRQFGPAEELAREMIRWFDSRPEAFGAETRGRLMLAYARTSLARKEYPRARAQFDQIAQAPEFEGTQASREAQLAIAEVLRLTSQFDEATVLLERLARRTDPFLQTQAYYQLGLVQFDQEEYGECLEHLEEVLTRAPDHADARILQARARIKLKQYEEPTEIEIGPVSRQRYIVPGKPLKITLEDRNLSVVGPATDIRVRVWTRSGDEETFSLVQFGDTKTKFRGTINTRLAPVVKGDGRIQLLGDDRLYYDYAPAFKEARHIESDPGVLTVRSDAELYASSGTIRTREELAAQALEQQIRSRLQLVRDDETPEPGVALSRVRPAGQVKPGNAINVRVVDFDRSATAKADTLTIRATATSGDTLAAFELTETGTHTGVFEGSVPTASGQARAWASDSSPTADPNMVISSKDYPPWVGLPGAERPVRFSVDLNDSCLLGRMDLKADVPGRRLKRFAVQTSMNARTFERVGAWPEAHVPWDGSMRLEVVKLTGDGRGPTDLEELREYVEWGFLGGGGAKHVSAPKALAVKWGADVGGIAERIDLGDEGRYVARFRAAFYQERRQVRTFVLDPKNKTDGISYVMAVDGAVARASSRSRGAEAGDAPPMPEVKTSLGKGVHVIEVFVTASRGASPEFQVLCDTPEPPYLVACPAGMFDPERHPEIREALAREPATVTAEKDDTSFTIAFPDGMRARVVRLLLIDFETDAPGITRMGLTDAAGKAILPTEHDFLTLRENRLLELVPGDKVTITYEDPTCLTRGKEHHEAFLTATYSNAETSAAFVEYTITKDGERRAHYIPMRRFGPGDKINVFINDPDMDVSKQPDTVRFQVRTSEGQPVEHMALETGEHDGVFVGGIFPVEGEPKRDSEVRVAPGDDVIITYLDRENTDPGIPWTRTHVVEQVWYEPPQVRTYTFESRPLTTEELAAEETAPGDEAAPARPGRADTGPTEHVPVTRTVVANWPELPRPDEPATALIGLPLLVEALFPAAAKSPKSELELFVQTSRGRAAKAPSPEVPFDLTVPGTIRLTATPSNAPSLQAPPGYKAVLVRSNPYALDALDDGRFTFAVPMELGRLPDESLAVEGITQEAEGPSVLKIKGDDRIFMALRWTDPEGEVHWATRTAVLTADPFFDIMDRKYQETLDGVYVGEVAYFRLIDPSRDTSDDKDVVEIDVRTTSGTTQRVSLTETFSHSGVFKRLAKVVYRGEPTEEADSLALPVTYGDRISATYRPGPEAPELMRVCEVYKGSDGVVTPFTKRFKDPAIAMQTQFTIAEAYFELAKRHRELGQAALARREIHQGKKLLQEAIRDFPRAEARAQAEYLLANLALEFANDAVNETARNEHFMEAVHRFSDIVSTYPDSIYAPKAQFKKALVFEQMGRIDQACEEYVKLSYRYPDNELVAETIGRLGQYFLTRGKAFKEQAEAQEDPVEREKVVMQSQDMFRTAGQVFGRLAVRFPEHRLADKTTVLSAQCFMQAAEYEDAVETFRRVTERPGADPELAAEAMYWCGDAYVRMAETRTGGKDALMNAYIMFKKLHWDYPATKWAKFARGRLTDPRFEGVDTE